MARIALGDPVVTASAVASAFLLVVFALAKLRPQLLLKWPQAARVPLLLLCLGAWQLSPIARTLASSVVVATISEEDDVRIGAAYAQEAGLERRVMRSDVLDRMTDGILQRLLGALPEREKRKYNWRLRVLDSPDVNAFALPGGLIYLNVGLLRFVGSAEELAGVVAHEIGHVLARHSQKQMIEAHFLSTLISALVPDMDDDGKDLTFRERISKLLVHHAVDLGQMRYSREDEFEADALALQILRDGGVGVRGLLTFFQSLEDHLEEHLDAKSVSLAAHTRAPALQVAEDIMTEVERFCATHPATDERIASLTACANALPEAERTLAWDGAGAGALSRELQWEAVQQALRL